MRLSLIFFEILERMGEKSLGAEGREDHRVPKNEEMSLPISAGSEVGWELMSFRRARTLEREEGKRGFASLTKL